MEKTGLVTYSELQESLALLNWPHFTEPYPVFEVLEGSELTPEAEYLKQEGRLFAIKQCQAYWHEDYGVVVFGKASLQQKKDVLAVLQTCWVMQIVANRIDLYMDSLLANTKKTMQFEKDVNPTSLTRLKTISQSLYEMRLLDLLISSPHLNGGTLMRKNVGLRLLFNQIADEELELLDYYDLVWERVEQSLDYYESWQEKLVEYRSFFIEAILEVIIIIMLVVSFKIN